MVELSAKDTSLYSNIRQSLYTGPGFEVFEEEAEIILKGLIGGITTALQIMKNPNKAIAVNFRDAKGIFKFGAKIKFNPNEDDDSNPGHYSYEMSFYEEDIKNLNEDEQKTYEYLDSPIQTMIAAYYAKVFSRTLKDSYVIERMCPIAVDCLLNWLSDNASDKETKIIIDGYLECTTVLEKGKKLYTITPSAQMKELVKEDTTTVQ